MPFLVALKFSFFCNFSLDAIISTRYSPIAGAEERPGDSMPAALKNPGASSASPRMKSPLISWARSPAKLVIT